MSCYSNSRTNDVLNLRIGMDFFRHFRILRSYSEMTHSSTKKNGIAEIPLTGCENSNKENRVGEYSYPGIVIGCIIIPIGMYALYHSVLCIYNYDVTGFIAAIVGSTMLTQGIKVMKK